MPLLFFFLCVCGLWSACCCCMVVVHMCGKLWLLSAISLFNSYFPVFFLIQWTCATTETKHFAWQFGSSGFPWGVSTKYRVFFHGKFVISTLHALDNFIKPIEMRTFFRVVLFFSAWNLTHHRCHAIHLIFKWPFNLTWTENNMMGCTPSTGVVWAYKKC